MNMKESSSPTYKSYVSSMKLVASSYSYRFDSKSADPEFLSMKRKILDGGHRLLGHFLPSPFVKGFQPNYLDQPNEDSIPIANTLSIQNLSLKLADCRHVDLSVFEKIPESKKLIKGDVLLTVDGGVSIGKPFHFNLDTEMSVDSHVAILRPVGISSLGLTFLLASPICQMQFKRAESGASGQTTVTEDDIRRFVVPISLTDRIDEIAVELEKERAEILRKREMLDAEEVNLWNRLSG